jgi:hypothetical protein
MSSPVESTMFLLVLLIRRTGVSVEFMLPKCR